MNSREVLAKVPLFAETLDEAELDALAASARRVEFDRAATLMHEGDHDDSMLVIVSGTVNVSVAASPQTVATLGEGDMVGEMSLLTGAPRSATVTAVRPVVALEVTKADVEPLLVMSPSLFERFAAVVESRRADLDRVYGPSFADMYLSSQAHLVGSMRAFFGR